MKIKRKNLEKIEHALATAILARRHGTHMWALNDEDTKIVRDALVLAENALDGIK